MRSMLDRGARCAHTHTHTHTFLTHLHTFAKSSAPALHMHAYTLCFFSLSQIHHTPKRWRRWERLSSLALSFSGGERACLLVGPVVLPGRREDDRGVCVRSCPPFCGGQKGAYAHSGGASTTVVPGDPRLLRFHMWCVATHARREHRSHGRRFPRYTPRGIHAHSHPITRSSIAHFARWSATHARRRPSASRNNTGGLSYNVARSPLGPLHTACSSSVTFSILTR